MSLLNLLEEFIMFEKIRKMKNKKGFTLVELIVVLVILAILAALLVPALTGYIDKANNEKVVSETRMLTMAIQTEASSAYAEGSDATSWATDSNHVKSIISLAEIKALNATTKTAKFAASIDKNYKVKTVNYFDGSKYYCTYDSAKGTYEVGTTAPSTELNNTVAIG